MRARAPASSANLGPGFDTLALALALYVEVGVEPADAFSITTAGEGSDLPCDRDHLAARVVMSVLGHDRVAIDVVSDVPVGRGLGSSASLAVAAAAAAGAPDVLAVGAAVDGHPENAAASVLGGLVAAATVDGGAVAHALELDPALRFVVVVPDRQLPTKEARAALPASVPYGDASFNLGRLALLVAGLADHRRLAPAAFEDRLHQSYRASLYPEAAVVMAALVDAGALGACWSGAGPTLLAVATDEWVGDVVAAGESALVSTGMAGRVLEVARDTDGVVVL